MTTCSTIHDDAPPGHDWQLAGEAWGHAAADWAFLFEHYATDAVSWIHRRTGVGPGVALLDVACGAGLALRRAVAAGALVAGIDASPALIDIARSRLPGTDLRVGSMFALPWPAASFDAVTSVNGIWGGCDAAVVEAARVLRPGGALGISFWGPGPPLDIRLVFKVIAARSPQGHHAGMRQLNDIATPGVAERMLASAGFEQVERAGVVAVLEWPDADIAWRAISSIGPAVPALRHSGADVVRREVLAALEPCRDDHGTYRLRNDLQVVVAHKPAGDPASMAEVGP